MRRLSHSDQARPGPARAPRGLALSPSPPLPSPPHASGQQAFSVILIKQGQDQLVLHTIRQRLEQLQRRLRLPLRPLPPHQGQPKTR